MVYIYESHLGGFLVFDHEEPDLEMLYCEQCGDSDELVFASNDIYECKEWARSQLAVFGLGGYAEEYLGEILAECEEILEGEDE